MIFLTHFLTPKITQLEQARIYMDVAHIAAVAELQYPAKAATLSN